MTVSELIAYGRDKLRKSGDADAEYDARLFAMDLLKADYTGLFAMLKEHVAEELCDSYKESIARRIKHEPTQYIIGSTGFMGYEFYVQPGVLIPRQETELLVEHAHALTKDRQVINALDMCCGSGCIGISYKLYRGGKGFQTTDVTLADISDAAILLSRKNDDRHHTACDIIQSDLFQNIDGKFDIILSNPPYIKTSDIEGLSEEVRSFEPLLALDGEEDGLFFYRRIINEAVKYLNKNGMIVFEIGCDQFCSVKEMLFAAGFSDIMLIKDYAGLDRIVSAVMDC